MTSSVNELNETKWMYWTGRGGPIGGTQASHVEAREFETQPSQTNDVYN